MSRRILATMPAGTTYPNLLVEVACAFGADLTDIDGSGWSWTDITDDVILEGPQAHPLTTTIGRADESSVTQTSVFKAVLDNRSGKYINTGTSTYWPYVRRGTPVRMRVSTNNGSSWTTRFQGQAVGFTPSWDQPGRWATVELEASGPLRVLDQGTLPAVSVYTSQIPTASTAWPGLQAYWPCEGGNGIDYVYPVVPAAASPRLYPDVKYLPKMRLAPSGDAFPVSGPLPSAFKMYTGTGFPGPIGGGPAEALPAVPNTGTIMIRWVAGITSLPGTQTQPLMYFRTTNTSPVSTWGIMLNQNGDMGLYAFTGAGGSSSTYYSQMVAFNANNTARLCSITLANSGGNVTWTLHVLDQSGSNAGTFTDTINGVNIGTLTGIDPVGPATGSSNVIIGHVSTHNATAHLNLAKDIFLGLSGEFVGDRIQRVAGTVGIFVDFLGTGIGSWPTYTETADSITLTCGPQYYDTVSNILRETEATGQGLLYDGIGPGLAYITRRFRQQRASGPAALALDAEVGHLALPFDPIDDDQILFNHCAVSRNSGQSNVEYLDVTGPEGVDIVGDHSTSITVNTPTDVGLIGYAQWGVNVGTVPGFRYPTTSFALHTNPSLIPGWLACVPQSRIDITNINSVRRQLSPDPIWLLLEGWTETISMFEWNVTANTSSAEPWNVIRLAAATGSTGDDICHMDTDSSQLNTSAAAGATSISVRTNSGPLWVTSAADADSFPFWITVGGLRVQVTAISGASSPQTFTLASPGLPAAKTGSTTPGAGAPIQIWRPPVLGLG